MCSIAIKPIYRLFAELTNEINSGLEIERVVVHDDGDHVVRIPFGLFDIVGKNILLVQPKRNQEPTVGAGQGKNGVTRSEG